jgi:hypothetical protein
MIEKEKDLSREIILRRATDAVKPRENPQVPSRIFCAEPNKARALLKNIVLMVGAMRELELGSVDEKNITTLAIKMQEFLLGLGDQLMVDVGLTEADLNAITLEVRKDLVKTR